MYKPDQQWLICHKTKPNQTKPNFQLVLPSTLCINVYDL